MDTFKYRAFISYSHADEKWARWLHRALETYRIPKRLVGQKTAMGSVPPKLSPVFRDREELASATDLGSKLTEALEGSACQIVICSRSSARSHWVNEEILAYKRLGRSNRIFSLIVDGEPYASGIPGEEEQECFPAALRYQIGEGGELTQTPAEPIAADARPGKDGKAHAKVKLIAGILGVGFDDLRQRELQRRNRRLALISTSAVAGMIFAIGLATTAFIARNEAELQRARAEKEAETARRTASFMTDLFAVSDPSEARGNSITAREILNKGAEKIATELGDQPLIQTSLMDTIGKVYTGLGLYSEARAMLEETVALRRQLPGVSNEEFARSAYNLGNVLTEKAEYERAARLYEEAINSLESAASPAPQLELDITAALAELRFRTGEYEAAEPLLREVLSERRKLLGAENPKVADAIEELGLNYFDQGRYEEAESRLREALALREKILGSEPHPALAGNISNLALIRRFRGDLEEAQQLYTQTLEMNHQLYGEQHPEIAIALMNLADVLTLRRHFDEAEAMYNDVIRMSRELLGEEHPQIAIVLNNLAFVYHEIGKQQDALAKSREALAMQRRLLGDRHPDVASSLAIQGRWLTEAGSYSEAEAALRSALEIQLETMEAGHPQIAITRMDLAQLLLETGHLAEALEQAELAETALKKALGPDHWRTAAAMQTHGAVCLARGDLQQAEKLLLASYEKLEGNPNAQEGTVRRGMQLFVTLYRGLGKTAKAKSYQAMLERRFGIL